MYIGVDIGGTKTLVAAIDDSGVILEKIKFPTNKDYEQFLNELKQNVNALENKEFQAGGVGMAASVMDREHGRAISFGNLPWTNVSIQKDIEEITSCPMVIENDAKMAALSEAMLVKDEYARVLYVTVSTGIGFAIVDHQIIDDNFGDAGGKSLMLEHNGQTVSWESFASGHAIVEEYHQMAKDINDPEVWKKVSAELAQGFIHLIAVTEPDLIVIGGSVGNYYDKYGTFLIEDIKEYHMPLVKLPVIRGAQRPDDCVIYGCYDLAKQKFSHV
jgi:predicted NBD/HSP70 family sugar kinase